MSALTYDDFKRRLNIQDVLIDAGYTLNRRDGLRYPSYVRLDNTGRRIRGDKFIVTANGLCCFQPPVQKNYNIISFIKEHPDLFADYTPGMDKDRLVNLVCHRLLNEPADVREAKGRTIVMPLRDQPPFKIEDYTLHAFKGDDRNSQKAFYPYFKPRGLSLSAQYAFHKDFFIASHTSPVGTTYSNLSFPMRIPGQDAIVGFEERGRKKQDGKAYKGMALGSNASEGLWLSSPLGISLHDTKRVFVFESAFDAMAYYQLMMDKERGLSTKERFELRSAVFVSTGGSPATGQLKGLIEHAPSATFHLCFDNDLAGEQFVAKFEDIAKQFNPLALENVSEEMRPFIESYHGGVSSLKEMNAQLFEHCDYLPKDLRDLYTVYDSARAEAYEQYYSPLVAPDDKDAAVKTMEDTWKTFKDALYERLHVTEGQELRNVQSVRELPSEGYKDFNDELLDKKAYTITDQIETALDGTDFVIEEQDEYEEEKRHGIHR